MSEQIASPSRFVAGLLAGVDRSPHSDREAARPLRLLGAFATAAYLQLPDGSVFALLTCDAVRLPIGWVLPVSSRQLPLDRLFAAGSASAGATAALADGTLLLPDLRVRAGARWSAAIRSVGAADPGQLAVAWDCWRTAEPDVGFDLALAASVDMEDATRSEAVAALLGRGPGLTPSGDDLLCGLLAGLALFATGESRPAGQPLGRAVRARLDARPAATTSLSRQLLDRALAGEAIPEAQAFGAALAGGDPALTCEAWNNLSAVGASSGAAIALGIMLATGRPANERRTAGECTSEKVGASRR